jgi:hypothetical protein
MNQLNQKIRYGRSDLYSGATVVGVHGYYPEEDGMKVVHTTNDNQLKVAIASNLVEDPDLAARTDIGDSATSTFLKCDSSGVLQVNDVSAAGGGGGSVQYAVGTTGMGSGTGTLMIGNFAGSAKEIAANNNGQLVTELGFIDSSIYGQDTKANSLPVTIANDQGALTVDGSGVTQPISAASLPLPAGAATEVTLKDLESRVAVCATNDVTVTSSALPAGAATEATLAQVNDSAATVASGFYPEGGVITASDVGVLIMGRNGTNAAKPIHITNNGDVEVEIADFVKGQDVMADSFPVVISSDQSYVPTIKREPLNQSNDKSAGSFGTVVSDVYDMANFSRATIFGNTNDTSDEIKFFISGDNVTYYQDGSNGIFPGFSTGNFVRHLDSNVAARYFKLEQTDTVGAPFTVQFNVSQR